LEFLIQQKIELVVIDSSPFVRCLQTASAIAEKIGIETIHVNYLACEWLKGKFYPEGNPVGKLLVETVPH
jgi:broad specificity phosphatase PhoE